jgi:hypothetical protein
MTEFGPFVPAKADDVSHLPDSLKSRQLTALLM